MRITSVVTVISGILAFVFTLSATSQPADAGTVFSKLKLSSPCICSSDMKTSIKLGKRGNDGDFMVKTRGGSTGVKLDGDSGNVTNIFLNRTSRSNGLVKAWAMIKKNGTVRACWRCNKDKGQTRNRGLGGYEVDFTPLSTDISKRPRLATTDIHGSGNRVNAVIGLSDHGNDKSTVFVLINRISDGTSMNAAFVLMIF